LKYQNKGTGWIWLFHNPQQVLWLFPQCRVGAGAMYLACTCHMICTCDVWWGFGEESNTTQVWFLLWKSTRKWTTFN
jgi:hypothetical protein